MKQSKLDFAENPKREIGEKILTVARTLFDSVKSAPIHGREGFPKILRNNNFGLTLLTTNTHAFLEITTKFHAQRERQAERVQSYRQIFTSSESGERAMARLTNSRLIRVGGMNVEGAHAFALGPDLSMCAWDVHSTAVVNGHKKTCDIDIIYVVGFGESIRDTDAWMEFDTIIRVTFAGWIKAQ